MKQINGKFNSAKVFTDTIDPVAEEQIKTLCNQEFTQGSLIRVMPDVHAGAGCTIGTTMTVKDKIVPNLVGVDIGCGMATYVLREKEAVIWENRWPNIIRKKPEKTLTAIRSAK